MKRISFILSLVILISFICATAAIPDDFIGGHIIARYEKTVGPYPSPFFDATKKLGRGIVNCATAPIELLKQPVVEAEKGESAGEFLTGLVYGSFAGIAWTFYRELDGVYEILTFYLPSLEPAIDPPYIF